MLYYVKKTGVLLWLFNKMQKNCKIDLKLVVKKHTIYIVDVCVPNERFLPISGISIL